MSFCPVRSGLTVCLMTLLSFGAWSAYAQDPAPKEEAAAANAKTETAAPDFEKAAESISRLLTEIL